MKDENSSKPNARSTTAELYEFRKARERLDIIEEYNKHLIDKKTAMSRLGVGSAQFHRVCRKIREKGGVSGAIRLKKGRKVGMMDLPVRLEKIIDEKFERYFKGSSASVAEVWRQVQAAADVEQISCPSYYTIRRWIIVNKKARDIEHKRHGAEAASQIYGAKPGRYPCSRPLEWVQIDHTPVDVLVVDDEDPTIIIGRPWASFAIDIFTRAVLGFHLSLLAPSSVSVAMVIANSVLPKKKILEALGLRTDMLPMHGLMEAIHTDNAKEFVSKLLETTCEIHGIKLRHRDVGRKHQGGHIERLIGTMMTTRVHFYRGTTYSNSIKRRGQSSESTSALTFKDVRDLMIHAINVYHGTIHSSLRTSPLNAWVGYHEKHGPPKVIDEKEEDDFRSDFFPEQEKIVQPGGINILGRRYWGQCLADRVRERVLVKFDPYDTSSIKVLLGNTYIDIPCAVNQFSRASDFEVYRYQKSITGTRPGTVTSQSSRQSILDGNAIQDKAVKKKEAVKRRKAKAAKVHHKEYKEAVASAAVTPMGDPASLASVAERKIVYENKPNEVKINFSESPVIFEVD